MTALLDANLLIALTVQDHVHHDVAEDWFDGYAGRFATCPSTQGSLIRLLIREGQTAGRAIGVAQQITEHALHDFWPDSLSYDQVRMDAVIGHRQVTDAYLAQLARSRDGRLVTLDRGMAAAHPDVVDLIDAR